MRLPRAAAWWGALWAVLVGAVTTPTVVAAVPGWLDGSWEVGLDLAARQHLSVGSRLFFTYGPYGFLDNPVPFFARQWLESAIAIGAVHLAVLACILLLLRRLRASWPVTLATTAVLALGLHAIGYLDIEGSLLAILAGVLALLATNRRGAVTGAIVAGAMLALLLLVKATGLLVVAGVLPVLVVSALVLGRRALACWLAGSFVVAFAVLWAIAGMGAADLARYVQSSWQTASGYAAAQQYGGVTPALILGSVTVLAFAALAIEALVRRRGVVAAWLLLALVLLLAAYKDAFVRSGPDRDAVFFAEVAVLAVLSYLVAGGGRTLPRRGSAPLWVAAPLAAAVLLGIGWRTTTLSEFATLPDRLGGWGTVAHAVVDSGARQRAIASTQAEAAQTYAAVIAAAALPPGATVDFFPSDVGFFYADPDVTWTPRPVLQSYQGYTTWLDGQDASFYDSAAAPHYLLFRTTAIDLRYPMFEEPAAIQAVLRRYRFVKTLDTDTVLLERSDGASPPTPRSEGRACAPIGSPLSIPQVPGRRLFGRVDMGLSRRGQLLDIALKPAQVDVTLQDGAGPHRYRFIWTTAADGVYLSSLVESAQELAGVLQGTPGSAISTLTLTTTAAWEWKTPVCVDFFSLPG